ncbi:MAG: T9SS type A sorting domain-containing protein [Bacteroidota bacterium]
MKKISTLFISALMIIFCSFKTNATTVIVNVEDFEFDPAIFTINVGDQVMWMWDNSAGQHTTTSTTIPAGATSWDEVIGQNSQMFTYTATVPGSYDYVCLYHQSMGMIGHFTVNGSTGISAIPTVPVLFINGNVSTNKELTINFGIRASSKMKLQVFDILGKSVHTFVSSEKAAGTYTETYSVAEMKKGIYILELETTDARITRKIVIQ